MFNDHVREAIGIHHNTIYVALQGSQNYKLNYENSDIDTKAILVPTLKEISRNTRPISTTYVRSNNEHIDFKDIRLIFNCYRKQNINFIETLFSTQWWGDSYYLPEIGKLRYEAANIAYYDRDAAIRCMAGMAYEKYHALYKPYPAQVEDIEKFGYAPKQLHHLVRLVEFMERYIKGVPYAECLISEQREYLIELKRGVIPYDKVQELADSALLQIDQMKTLYLTKPHPKDEKTGKLLDNIQYTIIEKALRKEILQ